MVMTDEGWHYEAPDYTVGIMGGGWVHDSCPSDSDDQEVTEEELPEEYDGDVLVQRVRLTCSACGQSVESVTRYRYHHHHHEEDL